MKDRHRDVALFRYSLIRPVADESLTAKQRGRLVRLLAAQDHAVVTSVEAALSVGSQRA